MRSCLASIPRYLISLFKSPMWALELINSHMANCVWSDSEGAHKIHLANWSSIYMKKEFGGMGVLNLQDMNVRMTGA